VTARARAAQGLPDANQAAVIGWYEALYCQCVDTSKMGGGFPDLVVRIPTRLGRILQLVEVKTRDGRLSPAQLRFDRDYGPVTVVRTREDVEAHVAEIRERFKGR
jgi:hypothetical protein